MICPLLYYTPLNSKGAGCIIYILKFTPNLVLEHRYTNKENIDLEFFHGHDISDGLCGSVSGLSELIVSNRSGALDWVRVMDRFIPKFCYIHFFVQGPHH